VRLEARGGATKVAEGRAVHTPPMTIHDQGRGTVPLVGILLFDDVEVLDFAGPYEVCSGTTGPTGAPYVRVVTVGTEQEIRCRGGLRVRPDHGLADCPALDALIVPGGPGADDRTPVQDELILPFLRERADSTAIVASVCTGA